MLIRRSPFNILIRGFNSICRTGPTRRAAWSGYSFSEDALFVRRMFAGERKRERGTGRPLTGTHLQTHENRVAYWAIFTETQWVCIFTTGRMANDQAAMIPSIVARCGYHPLDTIHPNAEWPQGIVDCVCVLTFEFAWISPYPIDSWAQHNWCGQYSNAQNSFKAYSDRMWCSKVRPSKRVILELHPKKGTS